jgi:hypothetical protein
MKSDRKNKSLKGKKTSRGKQSRKESKKLNKSRSRKSQRKQSRKTRKQNGGECEYLKVQGIDIPDLKIPEQYGLLNESCQASASNNAVLHGHPNMST